MAAFLLALLFRGPALAVANETTSVTQMSQADVIHSVLPSVVNITIWKAAEQKDQPDEEAPLQQYYGSGFVIDPSGLILTNRHVINGAKRISVTFSDGTRSGASICNVSVIVDLAIVKITPREALTPCAGATATSCGSERTCWRSAIHWASAYRSAPGS